MNIETPTRLRCAEDRQAPDLSEPSLEGLAYLLRHPELWPEHGGMHPFHWDFGTVLKNEPCGSAGCALGLATLVWGTHWEGRNVAGLLEARANADADWLDGTGAKPSHAIFYAGSEPETAAQISPAIVAGRIDDLLAGRPIRVEP